MVVNMLKTTKIKGEVLERINSKKGRYTIGDYIELMLDYFQLTGINPEDRNVSSYQNISAVMNQVQKDIAKDREAYFKKLSAIERDTFIPMFQLIKDLKYKASLNEVNPVGGMEVEENKGQWNDLIYELENLNFKVAGQKRIYENSDIENLINRFK